MEANHKKILKAMSLELRHLLEGQLQMTDALGFMRRTKGRGANHKMHDSGCTTRAENLFEFGDRLLGLVLDRKLGQTP